MASADREAAPGWPLLVGFCVAIHLRAPAILTVEATAGGGRQTSLLKEETIWARVVGCDRAGIWIELWQHVLELGDGRRKADQLFRHFVPFANIVSACTRCPEVFGDARGQHFKGREPQEGGSTVSLAIANDSS